MSDFTPSQSVNRIIGNVDNAVRSALITASNQRGSTDIRLIEQTKQGRGRLNLTGTYTGAQDTEIEAAIIGGAGASLRATTPVIRGVGNGQMMVLAITPGAVPETLSFSLLDAGKPAIAATLDFYGVTLAAKTAGAAGNGIALSVTQNLSTAPLPYATLDAIANGTTDFTGPQFDWGSPASPDGNIPASAPRLRFKGFPQVHRAYKQWLDGAWSYHIDPAPAYDIPADTPIEAVSGDYALSLTDGTTTEAYSAITLYDFLTQVAARSSLITVRGTIAPDFAPGGMAVTDIPLRTDAHALPVIKTVKSIYAAALEAVEAATTAPTENISISTLGMGAAGREVWRVKGSVSGQLPDALTGQDYAAGPIAFRIPPIVAPITNQARISGKVSYTSRDEAKGEGTPAVCLDALRLGAMATDKTITFTYTKRPPADCHCEGKSVGKPSDFCLGLEDQYMGTIDPAYQTRLEALYQWRRDAVAANTGNTAAIPSQTLTTPASWNLYVSFDIYDGNAAPIGSTNLIIELFSSYDAAAAALSSIQGQSITSGSSSDGTVASIGGYTGTVINTSPVLGVVSLVGLTPARSQISYVSGSSTTTPGQNSSLNAAITDINWINQATAILADNLAQIANASAATTEWDALFSGMQADLAFLNASTADDVGSAPPADTLISFLERYKARADYILTLAGIVPKSDASSTTAAGDGCWQDDPSATFWWVADDDELAPAFTNQVYVSSRKGCGQNHPAGQWFSTQEFGFGLVVDCADRLKAGDSFKITIKGTGGGARYDEGDSFVIPLIAAQAAPFSAGEAGDATHIWAVRGSVTGSLPDWAWNPQAPSDYTAAPAATRLALGGIPFEVGDVISTSIEGGLLHWRRDGGAWAQADLFGGAIDLGDGLTLNAEAAGAPSFLPDDGWRFVAKATYGTDNLRQPRIGKAFAFDADAVVIDLDFSQTIDCPILMLALHTLPDTATITLSGGINALGEWTSTPAISDGQIIDYAPSRRARYLTLTVTGAGTGAQIGWLYAGAAWQPSVGASSLNMIRQYSLARGAGINAGALYRGRGTGGLWRWSIDEGGALTSDNADKLMALVDHVAINGIEPVCMVPDIREPARAALALIDTDALTLSDSINWQNQDNRRVSVDLPLRAVLA